jgi:hypothetical protein
MRLRPKLVDAKAGTMDWNRSAEVPVPDLIVIAEQVERLAGALAHAMLTLAVKKPTSPARST